VLLHARLYILVLKVKSPILVATTVGVVSALARVLPATLVLGVEMRLWLAFYTIAFHYENCSISLARHQVGQCGTQLTKQVTP